MARLEWGFDHTDFGTKSRFVGVLDAIGAGSRMADRVENKIGDMVYVKYRWEGRGVTMTTHSNPVTGDGHYGERDSRNRGFAGYIGLVGEAAAVKRAVAAIKKYAVSIKDESPRRQEFINGLGLGALFGTRR